MASWWEQWRAERPPSPLLHLNTAACGRPSLDVLGASAAHTRLEAELGGYVAEEMAAETLETLHENLGGLLGTDAAGVALVESGSAARDALIAVWPRDSATTVGVVASDWGPNIEAFERGGLTSAWLDHDPLGRVDLESLEQRLRTDPPDIVHLTAVAAHSGLVQPVAAVSRLLRQHGIPLWVDAAQTLGHLQLPVGADAVYATSRKWLAGPRGVGILAIDASRRDALRVPRSAKAPDRPPVRTLESDEAHVAGRVALAAAVRSHLELGVSEVDARLRACGQHLREGLSDVDDWGLVDVGPDAGAIVALRPTAGQDVVAERSRLLADRGVLVSAILPWRSPELDGPQLRLSPHVDLRTDDIETVRRALGRR